MSMKEKKKSERKSKDTKELGKQVRQPWKSNMMESDPRTGKSRRRGEITKEDELVNISKDLTKEELNKESQEEQKSDSDIRIKRDISPEELVEQRRRREATIQPKKDGERLSLEEWWSILTPEQKASLLGGSIGFSWKLYELDEKFNENRRVEAKASYSKEWDELSDEEKRKVDIKLLYGEPIRAEKPKDSS